MQNLQRFLGSLWRNFIDDGCCYRASSLAFTSLLAVVPVMAIALIIMSCFPSVQYIGMRLEDFIFQHLVVSSGEVLQTYLSSFSRQALQLSWIGVIALMLVVVRLLLIVEHAFNCIWKLPVRLGRFALVRALLRQWLILLLVPMLLALSLLLSSYVASLAFLTHLVDVVNVPSFNLMILPPLFIFLALMIAYKFIPATKVYYRDVIVGALVGTVLFQMSKKLFILYLYFFPTYNLLYGAFAVIPLFLIWIYVVWLIVLLGAEISWLLGYQRTITYHHQ